MALRVRCVPVYLALLLSSVGCNGCGSRRAGGEDASNGRARDRVAEVPGVDLDELTRDERQVFMDVVNDELDPCGSPRSLARSLVRGDCRRASWAAKFVLRLVKMDLSAEEIGDLYVRRYGAQAVQRMEIGGSPATGGAAAPVTIVEFADFECPMCAQVVGPMDELVRRYEGRVRLVFKHYPIERHEAAVPAARAAAAAHRQGKFWEMHHALFAHQDALAREDLFRYAEQIGLEMEQFGRDFESEEVAQSVQADHRVGIAAGVDGTPTFFINGRRIDANVDELPAIIDEELDAQ